VNTRQNALYTHQTATQIGGHQEEVKKAPSQKLEEE
jgi:hypothetical protein